MTNSSNEQVYISAAGLSNLLINSKSATQGSFWTTDCRSQVPIRTKKHGPGSQKPITLLQMWQDTLTNRSKSFAMTYEGQNAVWRTITYQEYYHECMRFANTLTKLHVTNKAGVNIIGFNSAEWAISFYGSIFANCLPVGVYTTNNVQACEYVANHSQAEVVVMENTMHLDKYLQVKCPTLRYYVLYKGSVPKGLAEGVKVYDWESFLKIGEKGNKEQYREIRAGHCASVIYTSGTTGPPKGVMLSHDNYTWIAGALGKRFDLEGKNNRVLSYLPLSHVAAQLMDLILPVKFASHVIFADSTALQGSLGKFIKLAKPTIFFGVPRVWEKMQEQLKAALNNATGIKKYISEWARSIGAKGTHAQVNQNSAVNRGQFPSKWGIAKSLFYNKIKQQLGLDQCLHFVYGAAPLKQQTRSFYLQLNIFLMNGFGMSELAGCHSITNPSKWSNFSSKQFLIQTGDHLPGLQTIIMHPDKDLNGQICLRGRNCFMGYLKDAKETTQCIDSQGFLHSGDIGFMNANESISLTGRMKELIITAGGQNVAPLLIQNQIFKHIPILSYAVVIGDRRKYLTCLLCLKLKDASKLADEVVNYIKGKGSQAIDVQGAVACPVVRKIVEEGMRKVNERAISNAQRVQKWKILPLEFTMDSGVLTPTMKLKRKLVSTVFNAEIQLLYNDAKL